jgi:hypothetical protein
MNSNSKEMKRIIDAFKKPLRLNESMEGGEQLPNTITVKFDTAPAADTYRVVVVG